MGGEDVKVSVELSFMEAVQGCVKMFIILTDLSCETCVSVSKRFFCKGWKTSPNRAHRCTDKGTKGYKGGRCSSYFEWKSSIHSRFGLKNINVQTQSGFVPIDEHVRVIDGNGKSAADATPDRAYHPFAHIRACMFVHRYCTHCTHRVHRVYYRSYPSSSFMVYLHAFAHVTKHLAFLKVNSKLFRDYIVPNFISFLPNSAMTFGMIEVYL
ncbi:hypothetical protein ACS0TY_023363 [Phlomoides rotata]